MNAADSSGCRPDMNRPASRLRRNLPSLIYAGTAFYGCSVIIAQRNFVPIYDGWAFYKGCFLKAATSGDCECFDHIAHFPTAVYGAVVWLFPYNFSAFALFNLGLGLAACYALSRGLAPLFPDKDWFCHASATAFVLNPVMMAQMIQPSLDFMLAALTVFLVASLLAGERFYAFLIGCLMASTKEPGIMLYGVLLMGFEGVVLAAVVKSNGWNVGLRDAVKHSYLILPLPLFLFFAWFFGMHASSFGPSELTLADLIRKLVGTDVDLGLLIDQTASLFVLNFNWVLTVGVVCGAVALLLRPKNPRPGPLPEGEGEAWRLARQWLLALVIALAGGVYFHTRVLVYNCPRYVLPLFVILLCGAIVCLSQLRRRFPKLAAIGFVTYTALVVSSLFYTIDPISKVSFGTFRFGEHEMLSMGRFRTLPEYAGTVYLCRDQLVYNLQFIKLSDLAEAAVEEFGLDANYVVGPAFSWRDDFRHYDPLTGRRSMRPDAEYVSFTTFDKLSEDFRSGKGEAFVYLEFPNVLNQEPLDLLNKKYKLRAEHTVSKDGYSIHAYEFTPLERTFNREFR
ncbi:MAG: hypothetical protein WD669_10485 [Pirellulales bacterium]